MNGQVSTSKPAAWFPTIDVPSVAPIVELTASVVGGKLMQLSIATLGNNVGSNF